MPEARRDQAMRVALELLEDEGTVSMRRLADRMGMRAPSLYKHVPDKAELEVGVAVEGLRLWGKALAEGAGDLRSLASAYRNWALEHPHLYDLMTRHPLPRDRLPEHLEDRVAAPVLAAMRGNRDRARALWGAAHGLVSLELDGRLPADADLDGAWAALVEAFASGPVPT